MADFLDDNIITEEIDTGSSTSKVSSSPTEEFEFGGAVVAHSPVESVSSEISSPNVASLPKIEPAPDDMTSLDNLKAVSSVFESGCKTLSDLVKNTGLSQSVVIACLTWLQDNGLIAVSGSFYCTVDNVSALQSQLRVCQSCFGGKK